MKFDIKALARSASATMLLIAVITIWAEMSEPFKTFLKGFTGHHWVTKGVFALLFFAVVYFALPKGGAVDVKKETRYVVFSSLLAAIAIFLFYVWHFIS